MAADLPDTALELRSLVTSAGTLELSLQDVDVPTPGDNEVLVRIEASPINPSDLGLLVGSADMSKATVSGTPDRPVVTAPLIGPRTVEQLQDALRATTITLSEDTVRCLEEIWPGPGGEAPRAYAW